MEDQPRLDMFIEDGIAYFRRNGEVITVMSERLATPEVVDAVLQREMDKA